LDLERPFSCFRPAVDVRLDAREPFLDVPGAETTHARCLSRCKFSSVFTVGKRGRGEGRLDLRQHSDEQCLEFDHRPFTPNDSVGFVVKRRRSSTLLVRL